MNWSTRKQLIYGSIFLVIVIVVFGFPAYILFIQRDPTCFDGKQNQDETGLDCGGVCTKACQDDVLSMPVLLWARAFSVSNGRNNLVAYVQNPNLNYVSKPATYLFRAYDKDNVLIGTREGIMSVPPTKNFVVFEQAFDSGAREISKTLFEFIDPIQWEKYVTEKTDFEILETKLKDESTLPKVTARMVNRSVKTYKNFYVVAIIYDIDNNAIGSSRTYIEKLGDNSETNLIFTWPKPFTEDYSKIEIIPMPSL